MTFARVKLFSLRRDVDENRRRILPSPASPGVAGVAGQRPAAVAALAGAEPGRHDRHRRRVLPILRQRLSSELVSATSPQPGGIRTLVFRKYYEFDHQQDKTHSWLPNKA